MSAIRSLALLLAVTLAMSTIAVGQQPAMRWETNLDQALKTAASSNKLVLVHFWATWCKPCQAMEATVFKQPGLGQQLETQYVLVKLDWDQNDAIVKKFGVERIPTDLVLSPQGQVIAKTVSPRSADQYLSTMAQIATKARGPVANFAAKPAAPIATPPAVAAPPVQPSPVLSEPAVNVSAPPTSLPPQSQPALPALSAPPLVPPAAVVPSPVAPPPAATPVAPPVAPMGTTLAAAGTAPLSDSRYDYFFNRNATTPPAAPTAPPAANPVAANSATAPATTAAPSTPPATAGVDPRIAAQSSLSPSNVAPQSASLPRRPATQEQLPPGSPPLGLDGFCPVTLSEKRDWIAGDVQYGAVHRGRTYLFTGPAEQQKFLANPDFFGPVMSGNDPVMALNLGQAVPGRREHGVFYGGRVFLFSSENTLVEFGKNPSRYAAEITAAMRK